jgi:hypothetical protein
MMRVIEMVVSAQHKLDYSLFRIDEPARAGK